MLDFIFRRFDRLTSDQRAKLGEVVRFAIVGGAATLLQYIVYVAMLHLLVPNVALGVSYGVSFLFNYIATTYFTFRVQASARRGLGFAFSHVVNFSLQSGLLALFIRMGLSDRVAFIPMICICVPINFLLVRFFLKR